MGEEHETKALTRAEHDAIWRWINGQPSDSSVALPVARVLARLAQAELEISRLRGELAQAQPLVDAAKTWAIRANIDETTRVLLRDAHDRALDAEDRARGLRPFADFGGAKLTTPAYQALRNNGILTAADLVATDEARLRRARGVGPKMLDVILAARRLLIAVGDVRHG